MGIFIGLLTALTWGGADFTARFSTHRIGTLRTMFYMQFVGFLLLTISMRWLGGWGHLADGSGWQPWAWGLFAGLLNACGTLSLYRSFEIGKMAVVAPLSASYPALTLILSWLSGDHLSTARVAGILFILLGVAVVAGGEHEPSENSAQPTKANTRGIGWATIAAIAFGVLFWLLGIRMIPRVGAAQTVWMIRGVCTLIAGGILLFTKKPMGLPRDARSLGIGMGAADTTAFVLSNRGMQIEQVAVISVLGSLYGAVTVLLAAIFLRERVSFWQWFGIAAIFAGICLMSR